MSELFLGGKVELRPGDCRDVIKAMPDNSIDSVVTDPPYALVSIVKRFGGEAKSHLEVSETKDLSTIAAAQYKRLSGGFMGQKWDNGETAFASEFWAEVLRALKPGGHVVAFSGTRTYHRMAVAIEDAGFEIRDQLAWMYGSGFPKSHDVAKSIDKSAGFWRGKAGAVTIESQVAKGTEYERTDKGEPITDAAREWQGWGTALKPAWEPICLARKPLVGTVAANVLEWGTGALNIDATRVGDEVRVNRPGSTNERVAMGGGWREDAQPTVATGRWPANIAHDGSDEVLAGFPETESQQRTGKRTGRNDPSGWGMAEQDAVLMGHNDSGSAARFFYTAKADKLDRMGSKHPTVKPVDLMQWLVRMVTPKGGLVLDPFAGSGSTGEAAFYEGMRCILCEREPEYQDSIRKRLSMVIASTDDRKAASVKPKPRNDGPDLFS